MPRSVSNIKAPLRRYSPSTFVTLSTLVFKGLSFAFNKFESSSPSASSATADGSPVALTYIDLSRPTPTLYSPAPTPTLPSFDNEKARRLAILFFVTLLASQVLFSTVMVSRGSKATKGEHRSNACGGHPQRGNGRGRSHPPPRRGSSRPNSNNGEGADQGQGPSVPEGGGGSDPSSKTSPTKGLSDHLRNAEGFPEDPSGPDPTPPTVEDPLPPRNLKVPWLWVIVGLFVAAVMYLRPDIEEYMTKEVLDVIEQVVNSIEYWVKEGIKAGRKKVRRTRRQVGRSITGWDTKVREKNMQYAPVLGRRQESLATTSAHITGLLLDLAGSMNVTVSNNSSDSLAQGRPHTGVVDLPCYPANPIHPNVLPTIASKTQTHQPSITVSSPPPSPITTVLSSTIHVLLGVPRLALNIVLGIVIFMGALGLAVLYIPFDLLSQGSGLSVTEIMPCNIGLDTEEESQRVVQDFANVELGWNEEDQIHDQVEGQDLINFSSVEDEPTITAEETMNGSASNSWIAEADDETLVHPVSVESVLKAIKGDPDVNSLFSRSIVPPKPIIALPVLVNIPSTSAQPHLPSTLLEDFLSVNKGVGKAQTLSDGVQTVEDVFYGGPSTPTNSGSDRGIFKLNRPRPPTPQHVLRKATSGLRYIDYESDEKPETSGEWIWGQLVKAKDGKTEVKVMGTIKGKVNEANTQKSAEAAVGEEVEQPRSTVPSPPCTPPRKSTFRLVRPPTPFVTAVPRCFSPTAHSTLAIVTPGPRPRGFSPTASSSPIRFAEAKFRNKFFKFDFTKVCNFNFTKKVREIKVNARPLEPAMDRAEVKRGQDGGGENSGELRAAWTEHVKVGNGLKKALKAPLIAGRRRWKEKGKWKAGMYTEPVVPAEGWEMESDNHEATNIKEGNKDDVRDDVSPAAAEAPPIPDPPTSVPLDPPCTPRPKIDQYRSISLTPKHRVQRLIKPKTPTKVTKATSPPPPPPSPEKVKGYFSFSLTPSPTVRLPRIVALQQRQKKDAQTSTASLPASPTSPAPDPPKNTNAPSLATPAHRDASVQAVRSEENINPQVAQERSSRSEVDDLFDGWSLLGLLEETRSRLSRLSQPGSVSGTDSIEDRDVTTDVVDEVGMESRDGYMEQVLAAAPVEVSAIDENAEASSPNSDVQESSLPPLPPSPPSTRPSVTHSSVDETFDKSRFLALLRERRSRPDLPSDVSSIAERLARRASATVNANATAGTSTTNTSSSDSARTSRQATSPVDVDDLVNNWSLVSFLRDIRTQLDSNDSNVHGSRSVSGPAYKEAPGPGVNEDEAFARLGDTAVGACADPDVGGADAGVAVAETTAANIPLPPSAEVSVSSAVFNGIDERVNKSIAEVDKMFEGWSLMKLLDETRSRISSSSISSSSPHSSAPAPAHPSSSPSFKRSPTKIPLPPSRDTSISTNGNTSIDASKKTNTSRNKSSSSSGRGLERTPQVSPICPRTRESGDVKQTSAFSFTSSSFCSSSTPARAGQSPAPVARPPVVLAEPPGVVPVSEEHQDQQRPEIRGRLAIPGFNPTSPELGRAKGKLREAPHAERNVQKGRFEVPQVKLRKVGVDVKKENAHGNTRHVGNVFGVALRKVRSEVGDVEGSDKGKARVALGEVKLRKTNPNIQEGKCKDTPGVSAGYPKAGSSVAAMWRDREKQAQKHVDSMHGDAAPEPRNVGGSTWSANVPRDFWSRKI